MRLDWLLSLLVSISIGNFPSSICPWKNVITKLNCYSLVLLGFKLPPFYQVGYALRREKTKNAHSSISVAQVKRRREGKTGLCGGNGRRSGLPCSTCAAACGQPTGCSQCTNRRSWKGHGLAFWEFPTCPQRERWEQLYCSELQSKHGSPLQLLCLLSFTYTFLFPSHSHLWLRHAQPRRIELPCFFHLNILSGGEKVTNIYWATLVRQVDCIWSLL